jgi:hypothetical protein
MANTASTIGTTDRRMPHSRTDGMPDIRNQTNLPRSTTMYSMYEALARDRMREAHHRASRARLARQASAERRYHRPLSARARRAS